MSLDPHARFKAQDGLYYANFADFLVGKPEETYRNQRIAFFRHQGRSEAAVNAWIEGYDAPEEVLERHAKAFKTCPFTDTYDETDLRIANANESLVIAYGQSALYAPSEPLQPGR